MAKTIGVRFPYALKIYDFFPGTQEVKVRDYVIVETEQGEDIGQVVYIDKNFTDGEEIKTIKRIAKKEDKESAKELAKEAKELLPLFIEKIEKFKLNMRPVDVSYSFDKSKAIFYFTADGRIDFREIAKELSRTIKTQAVMRQIGPRDEAKIIGGYGRCGLPLCCATFMVNASGVSMEDVEHAYGMPKNANKVSGLCGRLMCCINFEGEKKK